METAVRPQCPFCQSKTVLLWTPSPCEYYRCFDCSLIFAHPLPSKSELDTYYATYHDKHHQADNTKNELRQLSYRQEIRWLCSQISTLGSGASFRVFDFGASGGYLLDELSALDGVFGYGCDRSSQAEAVLASKGYLCPLEDADSGGYDLVTIRGVLEHVPDFRQTFGIVSRLVRPKGFLFITATPNGSSACAILYRNRWIQHHYPSHILHFSAHHLDLLAAKDGLTRFGSVDLYKESPYFGEQDRERFLSNVAELDLRVNVKRAEDCVHHPYFGNMLTLLYQRR